MATLSRQRKNKGGWQEENLAIRLILGLIFLFFLTVFLHFREIRMEMLELDSTAKGYIVAQVDFEFPDPDATMILQQEALRDIGRIYKISEPEIKHVRHEFEGYLIHHPAWRKDHSATFEEMYNALDGLVDRMLLASLTDERTLKKRQELNLPIDNFYVAAGLDPEKPNPLPDSFWTEINKNVGSSDQYDPEAVSFVIDYFKALSWKIYNDVDAGRFFKQMIEKGIPQKFTQVKAGGRIIAQGNKVTQRHLAMLNFMKKQLSESRNLWQIQTMLGSLIFALIITVLGSIYFHIRQRAFFESTRSLGLYITIVILLLILSKVAEFLMLSVSSEWLEYIKYPIMIPFAAVLICLLINEEVALFSTFVLTVILGITLAVEHNYFLFINLVTGTTAVLSARHLRKLKEIFTVCFKVWISAATVIFGYNLVSNALFTPLIMIDLASAAVNLLVIAVLLICCIPILESLFKVMTDMTLMEYLDPTKELLQRLSMEAPGTYQHSLTIGHIAESVAHAIGANGLFCRVTTLYHDIGKLNTPHYYTENQMLSGSNRFNIHQLLTPLESAYIIKSHVSDGESLAKQYHLPQPFIDIIQQHHGTTLIRYFYAKQVDEMGGNIDAVDQSSFRYPGPKPQTKEAAIIMMADSTEAASRSLEDPSEEAITEMVNRIVADKVGDGQFDECPLTCKELFIAKKQFVEVLKAHRHLRIKYPEAPKSPLPDPASPAE